MDLQDHMWNEGTLKGLWSHYEVLDSSVRDTHQLEKDILLAFVILCHHELFWWHWWVIALTETQTGIVFIAVMCVLVSICNIFPSGKEREKKGSKRGRKESRIRGEREKKCLGESNKLIHENQVHSRNKEYQQTWKYCSFHNSVLRFELDIRILWYHCQPAQC